LRSVITEDVMKKLIAGVLLVVLSNVPSLARAESTAAPRVAAAGATSRPVAEPTAPAPTSEVNRYAERESATPELGEFDGGHRGIYIGGGAVTVLLIVLLVLILV
jgi:hypothetical protein